MIKEFEGRVTCDIPGSYQYDDDSSKGIRVTFQVVPVRCWLIKRNQNFILRVQLWVQHYHHVDKTIWSFDAKEAPMGSSCLSN